MSMIILVYQDERFEAIQVEEIPIHGLVWWSLLAIRLENPEISTKGRILSLKLHKGFGSTLTLAALTSLSERSSFRWSSSASKEKAVETGRAGGAIALLDFGRSVNPILTRAADHAQHISTPLIRISRPSYGPAKVS